MSNFSSDKYCGLLTWFTADGVTWNDTCSGICYNDWVMGNGTDYNDAYFEVGYVRVFSTTGTNTVVASNTTTSSGSSPTTSSTPGSSGAMGLPHGYVWMSSIAVLLVGLLSSALLTI